jgi:hypothetical protein
MTQPPTAQYDIPSRIFHWLTAIAVTIAFILGPEGFGRLMHQGVDPATRIDIVWHESLRYRYCACCGLLFDPLHRCLSWLAG